MYSVNDTRCRVGCPIRISTDQRLLAAPHGFSQRATSFIASWCQGIHRMPFLYSIARTWTQRTKPHHAQKPSSGRDMGTCQCCYEDDPGNIVFSAHNRNSSNQTPGDCLRNRRTCRFNSIRHTVSDHSLSDQRGRHSREPLTQSDNRPNNGMSINP